MPRLYVALDLETTGLQADRDAIIEIGAVKFRGDEILGEWSSLINPGRPLPHKIARLTGIHPRDVERAPALAQVLPRLAHFIGDLPVVGHNIQFDCNFLQRAGLTVSAALDTFELARILMPYASRYSLGRLMDELGIRFVNRHRAVEDARAVSQLFVALLERAQQIDHHTIEQIERLGARAPQWSLRLAFQDIVRDRARYAAGSIGAQLAAKNAATNDSLGLLFLREDAERPLKPKAHTDPLDVDALAQLLEPDGLFAQEFPGYEFRAPQVAMLRAVASAFNTGATLLVEAGTGTGKSLAYLIPAIYWAVQNNHRVVISTNTINLQDQLFTKDIPDVRRVLPVEFRTALLKGRSNYLCRRRLEQMLQSRTPLTVDQARVLAQVLRWLTSTTTGDNAELMLIGQAENAVWAQLASDPDYCAAERCILREQGKCFFYRAREKAERAHILIVNHALLLSDLITEHHVLPEFKYLIVDEAHHLEEGATKAFAFEASRSSLETMLRALAHERGGLLGMLAGAMRNSAAPPNITRETQRVLDDVAQDIERAVRGVYDFYNALENFVARQESKPNENEGGYDRQIRLTPARRSQPDWNAVELAWDELGRSLVQVRNGLGRLYAAWDELGEWEVPSYLELAAELAGAMRRVEETRAQLEALISKPHPNGIYWVTLAKNNGEVTVHSVPLYVGDLLQKQLFADKNATILTSATLCVDKSFAHIKARLGIGDWADELTVGSPFDFAQAALLCIPTDIPEPGQPGYQRAVESFLVELLRATQGRALVLFTSISQLNATYRAITRPLAEDEIVVLAQNLDGSRRQVLETFKTQARTVLLGTRSFWEGVDVVGEALSCLVITRLPFSVPSDPIFAARSETFDDPFNQYAVPEAVLRLRQGFGRLIRSQTDRGVVVLLDRRILSKNYGRVFLESLPSVSKYQGAAQELPNVAATWIALE